MLGKGLQPLKHIVPADYTEQTAILDHRQAVPSTVQTALGHLTALAFQVSGPAARYPESLFPPSSQFQR